jgi:hypothetical protein
MWPSGFAPDEAKLYIRSGQKLPQFPPSSNFHWNSQYCEHVPDYGNYCGQYRANGKDMDQSGLLPKQIGGAGNPKAIDGTDGCCLQHDQCRAGCDSAKQCDAGARGLCHCFCDVQMSICQAGVTPGLPWEAAANLMVSEYFSFSNTANNCWARTKGLFAPRGSTQ